MKKLLLALFLLASVPAYAQTAQEEIGRFVDFYEAELGRTGFAPDASSTRETRIAFLQQAVQRFCSPLLSMKRADSGRPISDEVVVFLKTGAEYRTFADFLISGGSSAWRLSDHLEGKLPISQPLVNPLTLGMLQEASFAPTVPGCSGPMPAPSPTPTPQPPVTKPYPGDAYFIEHVGTVLVADYTEAEQTLNAGSVVWISRTIWRYVAEGMSIEQSTAQSRKEWRAALGLPALP